MNFISYYRIMSQDKENVSRTSESDGSTTAAMTAETLSEAEKFNTLATNMMSTLKAMPKLFTDSMKSVVVRLENTVNNMEKLLDTRKPQKDIK